MPSVGLCKPNSDQPTADNRKHMDASANPRTSQNLIFFSVPKTSSALRKVKENPPSTELTRANCWMLASMVTLY